jgi:hypothetical protein
MEQFANLGTAAVLDADKLAVGSHVKIDGQLFIVEKIIDDLHVYFRPVIGWELWQHRWNKLNLLGKILFTSAFTILCIVVAVVIHIVNKNGF